MTFLCLEGLDKTGKSTIAEIYKKQGFKIIHFSAPDKKYSKKGYVGPSYLEDILEILISLSGQDVLFDRSWYGEQVWPYIYGRTPLLDIEDIETIREIEEQNNTERILMYDTDLSAHWQRCLAHSEPLDRGQFMMAHKLFNEMAERWQFTKRTLSDYVISSVSNDGSSTETKEVEGEKQQAITAGASDIVQINENIEQSSHDTRGQETLGLRNITPEQRRLRMANAIDSVLAARIIKKRGDEFEEIENKIRGFLSGELAKTLGSPPEPDFSDTEKTMLKLFVKRLIEKEQIKK